MEKFQKNNGSGFYGIIRYSRPRLNMVFTLIELLLVITILTIFTGMFLPVLKKARDKTNEIKCSSQMKQQGTAISMYVSDYDEYIPPYSITDESGNTRTWIPMLKEYMNLKYVSYNASGGGCDNAEALRQSALFLCPSDKTPFKLISWASPRDCGRASYSISKFIAPLKITRLPGNTSCVVEGGVDVVPYIYYYQHDTNSALYYLSGVDSRARSGHQGGMNVLFTDSHVKWSKKVPQETWVNNTL